MHNCTVALNPVCYDSLLHVSSHSRGIMADPSSEATHFNVLKWFIITSEAQQQPTGNWIQKEKKNKKTYWNHKMLLSQKENLSRIQFWWVSCFYLSWRFTWTFECIHSENKAICLFFCCIFVLSCAGEFVTHYLQLFLTVPVLLLQESEPTPWIFTLTKGSRPLLVLGTGRLDPLITLETHTHITHTHRGEERAVITLVWREAALSAVPSRQRQTCLHLSGRGPLGTDGALQRITVPSLSQSHATEWPTVGTLKVEMLTRCSFIVLSA